MYDPNALTDHLLDESHQLFARTCETFARQEILPHAHQWEEDEAFPRELYEKAGEAGILGPDVPEAYGGGGGDLLHSVVATEALLAGGSSGVAAGLGSLGIALPPVLALGSEEQKQRFIPPVVAGEQVAALAVTEPGTGSDVSGVRLRAERDSSSA